MDKRFEKIISQKKRNPISRHTTLRESLLDEYRELYMYKNVQCKIIQIIDTNFINRKTDV